MKPDKTNFNFLVSKLRQFGFKYKKTSRSLLEIDKEEVSITEITTRYVRDDESVVVTRIQVLDQKKTKQDIGLYLSYNYSNVFTEIFEIADFLEFFKDELRGVKISKILGKIN